MGDSDMNLLKLACIGIAGFALIQLLLLPALYRRLKAPQVSNVSRLVFLTLAAQILRSVCFVVGSTLGVVALAVLLAPLILTHGSQDELARAFGFVRQVHDLAESVDKTWGVVTIIV